MGDPDAALEAAVRRFGNCQLLAKELEASVPALERVVFLLFYRELLCGDCWSSSACWERYSEWR